MGKTCKRKRLPYIKNFSPVDLMLKQRIFSSVRWCSICRRKRLKRRKKVGISCLCFSTAQTLYGTTYLRWDVGVEMTRILRASKLRPVRRRIFMNILPVNAPEPGMNLRRKVNGNWKRAVGGNPTLIRCAPSFSAEIPG